MNNREVTAVSTSFKSSKQSPVSRSRSVNNPDLVPVQRISRESSVDAIALLLDSDSDEGEADTVNNSNPDNHSAGTPNAAATSATSGVAGPALARTNSDPEALWDAYADFDASSEQSSRRMASGSATTTLATHSDAGSLGSKGEGASAPVPVWRSAQESPLEHPQTPSQGPQHGTNTPTAVAPRSRLNKRPKPKSQSVRNPIHGMVTRDKNQTMKHGKPTSWEASDSANSIKSNSTKSSATNTGTSISRYLFTDSSGQDEEGIGGEEETSLQFIRLCGPPRHLVANLARNVDISGKDIGLSE